MYHNRYIQKHETTKDVFSFAENWIMQPQFSGQKFKKIDMKPPVSWNQFMWCTAALGDFWKKFSVSIWSFPKISRFHKFPVVGGYLLQMNTTSTSTSFPERLTLQLEANPICRMEKTREERLVKLATRWNWMGCNLFPKKNKEKTYGEWKKTQKTGEKKHTPFWLLACLYWCFLFLARKDRSQLPWEFESREDCSTVAPLLEV